MKFAANSHHHVNPRFFSAVVFRQDNVSRERAENVRSFLFFAERTVTNMQEGYDVEVRDIRERLIRIETLLEILAKTKETAENADKTANEALQLGKENARNLDGLKKFLMWSIGLIVPAIVTLSAAVISVVF